MRSCAVLAVLFLAFSNLSFGKNDERFPDLISSLPSDSLKKDTLIRIDPKPGSGFNFPYYLYIPARTRLGTHQFLLVETNNSGLNDTLDFHDREAAKAARRNSLGNSIARRLRVPYLVPVFPRTQKEWKIYTHAIDRDAMLIKHGDSKRLDLQLIAMIEDAGKILSALNLEIDKKVLLNGFSASGTFANRFTLIHPGKVAAVSVGGINAMPMLPVSSIDKTTLDYPLGTNDYKSFFGREFDLETYRKIPQFIYMGAQDNNDAALFEDAYSSKEQKKIFKAIGKTMLPDRWEKCKSVYEANGINATFKLYPDIGHGTNGKMHSEIAEFFKKVIQ
jgi:hypothetical protein